jgi:Protein of unknown function (DUF1549)/Protein of unknown function (DUF1553)
MVYATQRGRRPGRSRTLFVGGLCLIGLFGLSHVTGQTKGPAKEAPPKGSATTKTTGKAGSNHRPTTLKMSIVSKDADVAEMSKVINDKLEESWKANKITPSGYADDYEFIRRASLDIIGRSATVSEIQKYLENPPDKRRSMLIETLLKSEDYPRHWANMWSNWLLTRSGDFGRGKYHDQMTVWLEDQFAQNKPYNEMTTKLLTASGKNTDNGAVNFLLGHVGEPIPAAKQKEEGQFEMVPLTSRITRVFLGTQVQCAQCHAHPFFAALKQESFWGINAFLRQIKRDGGGMRRPRMGVLPDLTLTDDESVNPEASVFFEMRNGKIRMLSAEFLAPPGKERGPRLDPSKKGVARREELARHVTEHEMFAKAFVNRMWGLFYGRGFVNPVDDFNDNNQPSNPELLNELSARFKHYNYDVKKLIRWMTHSNAYHLSYVANKTNDKQETESQFSRMIMKSFTPEQLFESLMTASQGNKSTMKAPEKKKLREEWLNRLITNFGDDEGNEVNFNGTIVQALLMMNGKNINDAITSTSGTVAHAMASHKNAAGVVNELYLAALNRPPRAAELKHMQSMMALRGIKDTPKAMYEDLFWALLNSNEFLLNH